MEDLVNTRITDFMRHRRAALAASASFCERCTSVSTASERSAARRDAVRFAPYRTELFR